MFRKIIAALGVALTVSVAHAQVPTTDAAALASWVQQLQYMQQSVDNLKSQYGQLQTTYNSLNGLRDISGLLSNRLLTQYLPPDVTSTIGALQGNNVSGALAGISGTLTQIQQQNQYQTCSTSYQSTAEQNACQKQWQKAAMSQYVGEQGYTTAGQNIQDLQQFLTTIQTGAPDAKAMQDLQARISLEQVKQQNEAAKLQAVKMMQDTQDRMDRLNASQNAGKMLTGGTGIRF